MVRIATSHGVIRHPCVFQPAVSVRFADVRQGPPALPHVAVKLGRQLALAFSQRKGADRSSAEQCLDRTSK